MMDEGRDVAGCHKWLAFPELERPAAGLHQDMMRPHWIGLQWGCPDLNRKPSDYESPALTIELQPLNAPTLAPGEYG